ncbi:hypothetical protein SAY87_012395 [Trapa incisa]|uniref:Uncharacterized protein n=1 Tax=Trapa incisa TaxID=236973 RepID=A0AAN7GJZ5_9MYRT|nr:hypothetical protein SAY87_012395 [Trapa incisa]
MHNPRICYTQSVSLTQRISMAAESIMDANQKPLHPIHQIAATPTHKLLLKQWLKEEELILWRVALKETQIDSWIPSLCSFLCSLGLIWAVRYKTELEAHFEKLLEREKDDGKLLGKCVEELKRKGVEFDLRSRRLMLSGGLRASGWRPRPSGSGLPGTLQHSSSSPWLALFLV